jgi:photosystem II stability/assembly factor-like uncharacterized protein
MNNFTKTILLLSFLSLFSSNLISQSLPVKLECPGGLPTGLYVDPKTDLLYVGCYGGIWEYNVTSDTWKEVDSDPAYPILANAKVVEMLIDSKGVFYAGCDANTQSYISYDGGKKWQMIESVHLTLQNIYDIYEHPNGSVYFATGTGVVKTPDNGKTWVKISNTPQGINSVFSNNKGDIFLASSTGLYKSSGDESVWSRITLGNLFKPVYCFGKDSKGILFVGMDGAIYKSENDGVTWSILSDYTSVQVMKIDKNDIIIAIVGNGGSLVYFDSQSSSWIQFASGSQYIFPNYSNFTVDSKGNIFGLSIRYGLLKIIFNPSGIDDTQELPINYALLQNYPNPFNPGTVISYQLAVGSHVQIKVDDPLGREVATLVDEYKQAGTYTETFHGTSLPSGIYFYTLKAGDYIATKKMILLK